MKRIMAFIFELYMETHEINKRLRELGVEY